MAHLFLLRLMERSSCYTAVLDMLQMKSKPNSSSQTRLHSFPRPAYWRYPTGQSVDLWKWSCRSQCPEPAQGSSWVELPGRPVYSLENPQLSLCTISRRWKRGA